jgi:uncharacterized SAM-binding protein YcdF (DUF218 family)
MSLVFITFLIFISLFYLALKKNKKSFFNLTICLLFCIGAGSGFLTELLLKQLQIHEPLQNPNWQTNNVIVLLGSGATKWSENHFSTQVYGYSRLNEAMRLYFNCKKSVNSCTILISGGDPADNGKSEAEIMQNELINNNLPAQDIITETNSQNTFQNAKFSSEIIKQKAYSYIVLVTSGTHMPRALKFFKIFNINATPAISDKIVTKIYWQNATKNMLMLDTCLHEYAGLVKYYAFEMLGKN